jgi:hypothetical protein
VTLAGGIGSINENNGKACKRKTVSLIDQQQRFVVTKLTNALR